MALYTKESLDSLRSKVNLVDVLSSYIQMKRSGAAYKGLCPFHEEKTPSFMIQSGDTHYHCFGCGAHGDAIAFLMQHQKMTFVEAVESLADRFGIVLERSENEGEKKGPDRGALKEVLELACRFYHTLLLHTKEGQEALSYLHKRGITDDFISYFRIGFAPQQKEAFMTLAKGEGVKEEILLQAGLMTEKKRDFFSDRITFPITDPFGGVIGFSARKYKEETYGGKYINSPETPLFKKSHILFGLSYSRARIAKERKALIVEGQIDALRLIHTGFNYTVASQGTAFGEAHVKILTDLGVKQIFLAFDGDEAGKGASLKVGNLFQKKGISVSVIPLPEGNDPDSYVRKYGAEAFSTLLLSAKEYLSFLVATLSTKFDMSIPAQKTELITTLREQIKGWEEPVMIHESLRKVAQMTGVPESVIGIGPAPQMPFIKRFGFVSKETIDPDQILETDLLRWILLRPDPRLIAITQLNVKRDLFKLPTCQRIYDYFLNSVEQGETCDLMALGSVLEKEEEQKILAEILQKRVNPQKAEAGLIEVIQRLLQRRWMEERDRITNKIINGECSEEETLQLVKTFDHIKKNEPKIVLP